MRGAGRVPLRRWRVVLVVAGQVEFAEVVASGCAGAVPGRRRPPAAGPRTPAGAPRRAGRQARARPSRAAASRASPAATPSGDRSWGTPSYSCRPPYSRASATLRSQTARTRGSSSSMRPNATVSPLRPAASPLPVHQRFRRSSRFRPCARPRGPGRGHRPAAHGTIVAPWATGTGLTGPEAAVWRASSRLNETRDHFVPHGALNIPVSSPGRAGAPVRRITATGAGGAGLGPGGAVG